MNKMFIKESYVHTLPDRWVVCQGEVCGYEISEDDHTMGDAKPFRMFKVNGVQICEGCLIDWKKNIEEALQ